MIILRRYHIYYFNLSFLSQDIKEKTWEHLSDYGRIGLRTLVLAKKKIDNKVYLDWSKRYQVLFINYLYVIIK